MKKKFTARQLADWRAFERVRSGGRLNMLDPRARQCSGLSEKRYAFVMDNYSELADASEKKGQQ